MSTQSILSGAEDDPPVDSLMNPVFRFMRCSLSRFLFQTSRASRSLVRAVVLAVVVVVGLAACDSAPTGNDENSSDDETVVTYEAIEGEWTGSMLGGTWGRLEFRSDSIKAGKVIGTGAEFHSKGGELACRGILRAKDSDPPTYWTRFATDGDSEVGCVSTGTFRFKHDPDGGTLTWEWKAPDGYRTWGTLSRKDD